MGSKGETKNQLNKIVYGGLADLEIYGNVKNVSTQLTQLPSGYTFADANRAFSAKDEELLDSFKQNLLENFHSHVVQMDFSQNEQARQQINDWVKEKTQQKIPNLLSEGAIDPQNTKLVLVNALYFKGSWMYKFPKNQTKEAQFFLSEDQHFNVPMMESRNNEFHYADDKDVQVLGIPFENETMFMYFILPRMKFTLSKVEESLNGNRLLALFNKAHRRDKVLVSCSIEGVHVYVYRSL